MELFGIAFSVPVAFVASIVYSLLMRKAVARLPWVRRPVLYGSAAVLALLVLEWCLLGSMGILGSRETIGPAFELAHEVAFFLSIPALANVLVLNRAGGGLAWLLTIGILCAILDLPVVLTQYAVSEALYGIDGTGGPYGRPTK